MTESVLRQPQIRLFCFDANLLGFGTQKDPGNQSGVLVESRGLKNARRTAFKDDSVFGLVFA